MAEHFYYSIASGSSGNCGLYVSDGTAVLIDVGVSLRKLTAALAAFDMKPGELDALIITHEHIDHVKGLAMFLKKTEVPVFASRGTAAALTDRTGQGTLDVAITVLISIVLGALILAGLYLIVDDTVLPTITQRIKDMFNYAGALGG